MKLSSSDIRELLDEKANQYNATDFIADDPISIPHLFSSKEDIESIGFIMATIAWGNRKSIITNGKKLVDIMGNQPHEFIMNASKRELDELKFVHRTFNAVDLKFFVLSMRALYKKGGFEFAFGGTEFKGDTKGRLSNFRTNFLRTKHEQRSEKHISSPISKSACKRLNMYLRWMVRKDKRKVDFGIWNSIEMSDLYLPLDVHTGRIARALDLTKRHQNDWQTLEEIMAVLKKFNPKDPCKYDFALFGIGVNEFKD